jgi:hypothetical protein
MKPPRHRFGFSLAWDWQNCKLLILLSTFSAMFESEYSVLEVMRIVPSHSGGAILDLDWFLNYRDTRFRNRMKEKFVSLLQTLRLF